MILYDIIQNSVLKRTLDDWRIRLNEAGIPWGPVQDFAEVIVDPQARANEFFVPWEHPVYGQMELVANPIRLSRNPEKIRAPAPLLGQHTDEVLLEHGYSAEDVARFRKEHTVA